MTPEQLAHYEANKLHFLTRAAELHPQRGNTIPDVVQRIAHIGVNSYFEIALEAHAKTLSIYEPLPDPNAKLMGLVEEVLTLHVRPGDSVVLPSKTDLCLALINRLRENGLLREGV